MFSKAESQIIKKEFWTAFAEMYPRKWILYDTKIKDFSFKFYVDNKKALVMLDIEPKDEARRKIYFEKIQSLRQILTDDYLPGAVFEEDHYLETGKPISRIWVEQTGISLYNKASWAFTFKFFHDHMDAFERFFNEYQDYISDPDMNA